MFYLLKPNAAAVESYTPTVLRATMRPMCVPSSCTAKKRAQWYHCALVLCAQARRETKQAPPPPGNMKAADGMVRVAQMHALR